MMLPISGFEDDIESPLLFTLETTQVRCNKVEGLLTIDASTGDLKFTQVNVGRPSRSPMRNSAVADALGRTL
jgi:hypothetical protein